MTKEQKMQVIYEKLRSISCISLGSQAAEVQTELSEIFYDKFCSDFDNEYIKMIEWMKFDKMQISDILDKYSGHFMEARLEVVKDIASLCENATAGFVYDKLSEIIDDYAWRRIK